MCVDLFQDIIFWVNLIVFGHIITLLYDFNFYSTIRPSIKCNKSGNFKFYGNLATLLNESCMLSIYWKQSEVPISIFKDFRKSALIFSKSAKQSAKMDSKKLGSLTNGIIETF
jgi:hypothetical protein